MAGLTRSLLFSFDLIDHPPRTSTVDLARLPASLIKSLTCSHRHSRCVRTTSQCVRTALSLRVVCSFSTTTNTTTIKQSFSMCDDGVCPSVRLLAYPVY
jgi:hypothetical protein